MSRYEMQPGVAPAQIRFFRKAAAVPPRRPTGTTEDTVRYEDFFRNGSPMRRRNAA
ncbi:MULTISPECIES: hypothetical protein [unclassified Curtobacterium]|uniref:hypothetical protein n=1 Tax=unclassified Curtobacterium TaxID=257496 RepID=UPI0015E88792|nr:MULTISPECIES: hypothetical protein [unclassified Curtobacterium]WIB67306.1 hypothetical protein DEI93_15330 [Curtobacterium sp. MCBD17_035]